MSTRHVEIIPWFDLLRLATVLALWLLREERSNARLGDQDRGLPVFNGSN